MPAATHPQKAVPSGKKRRLDDDQQQDTLYQLDHNMHRDDMMHNSPPQMHRRFVPLANPKRPRRSLPTTQDSDYERLRAKTLALSDLGYKARHHTPTQLLSRCHICHRKPTKKSDLDSFADCQGCDQRTCFVCIRQCADWRPEHERRWTGYGSNSFHMEDADADAEKEKTKEKNDGWAKGGHRQVICSRCCVERGQDGDVVCLGCIPYV